MDPGQKSRQLQVLTNHQLTVLASRPPSVWMKKTVLRRERTYGEPLGTEDRSKLDDRPAHVVRRGHQDRAAQAARPHHPGAADRVPKRADGTVVEQERAFGCMVLTRVL